MASITWEGTAELNSKLRMIARSFKPECNKFLMQEAENILARAKNKTPVDTGHLKDDGWQRSEPAGGSIEIGNTVEYAGYV